MRRIMQCTFAAVIAALSIASIGPAGAEPVEISSPVTGALDINGNVVEVDGAVFEGTFDEATGALAGGLVFPSLALSVTNPINATIAFDVTQPTDGTGTVDPMTGAASFTGDLLVALKSVTFGANEPTALEPCTFTMPFSLTGTRDAVTGVLALAQDGFAIAVNPADGAPRCNNFGAALDDRVVGSTNGVALEIDLGVTDATPPEVTPTPEPTPVRVPVPSSPQAAAPVSGAPSFTG